MNVPLIHPKLYLGNLQDAKRWRDATVCIAGTETLKEARPTYGVYMEDRVDIDPVVFARAMRAAAACIREALMIYPRVLVHCYAGINRSVSALVAYTSRYGPKRCLVRAVGCLRTPRDTIEYLRMMNGTRRGVATMTNPRFVSLLTLE